MRSLGRVWRQHALTAGGTAELDRAIGYFRGELSQPGTALAAAGYNLALLLSDRYDALGVAADLEEATGVIQDALAGLPAGSAHRHDYLAMRGLCLWERYEATGSLSDLQRAIDAGAEAVGEAEPASPLWPRLNSNLGMMYLDRYERAGDAADLERAAALAEVAVESTSPGDDERPGFLNNLANALRIRFKLHLDPLNAELPAEGIDIDISDLNAAIKLYAAALTEPASNPAQVDRAMILSNFGDVLFDRADLYELTDEPDKAAAVHRQALAAHEEAIATTPLTAPDRPGRLNKLAVIQAALASRTSTQEDIDAARASFREACETGLQAAPESALAAASNWLAWEAGRQAWQHAVLADEYALRAANGLHRSQLQRSDRETWLLASRGLAAEAAYATIREGNLRAAVARLEQARAILLTEDLDLVSAALSSLPDPALTRRYDEASRLVRQLQSP